MHTTSSVGEGLGSGHRVGSHLHTPGANLPAVTKTVSPQGPGARTRPCENVGARRSQARHTRGRSQTFPPSVLPSAWTCTLDQDAQGPGWGRRHRRGRSLPTVTGWSFPWVTDPRPPGPLTASLPHKEQRAASGRHSPVSQGSPVRPEVPSPDPGAVSLSEVLKHSWPTSGHGRPSPACPTIAPQTRSSFRQLRHHPHRLTYFCKSVVRHPRKIYLSNLFFFFLAVPTSSGRGSWARDQPAPPQ